MLTQDLPAKKDLSPYLKSMENFQKTKKLGEQIGKNGGKLLGYIKKEKYLKENQSKYQRRA
ncbi:hypothetical protein A2917_02855 [Candidatus Nomurabacteria bacterium RIFCSPLOWO2_01_FULL_42_17]|uniref:Uncharacterized protein n=1 Tax=Candidatus Nomurabacteria bacterium RIFCSPLOWO2_01_FULL_42_17 TaxID=1801780 RepID=A0A1F6XMW9_9BACT|nr:MAG: hypothetical protein A2917_02855 [Candidatus Nomurabacteria bacterium RIFCSPLOWO2_01_FULL_42_17]